MADSSLSTTERNAKEARWWEFDDKGKILCTLCPRYCRLGAGQAGFCFIRKNIDNTLYSLGYGHPTGFAVDPIEKKPLSHFLPGTGVLSFGTAGCNLGCRFCQNWSMSKARMDQVQSLTVSPQQVVDLAIQHQCPSIAYTYNDPTIFGEYVIDISKIARGSGIRNVLVTAGYITPEARKEVYAYVDAVNIDLKAFSERFYHKLTFSHLENVLDTIQWLKHETEIWFEITTLLIPGENDGEDEIRQMASWIYANVGPDVPLHFTAFHPDFKMRNKTRTSPQTLRRAREIALQAGLHYVYTGNVVDSEGQSTYCPSCGKSLIKRNWHSVESIMLIDGRCPACNTPIAGVFKR